MRSDYEEKSWCLTCHHHTCWRCFADHVSRRIKMLTGLYERAIIFMHNL